MKRDARFVRFEIGFDDKTEEFIVGFPLCAAPSGFGKQSVVELERARTVTNAEVDVAQEPLHVVYFARLFARRARRRATVARRRSCAIIRRRLCQSSETSNGSSSAACGSMWVRSII